MSRHKNKYNLTPKQEAFCHAYMKLGSVSDAYREAFNSDGMKASSIRVEGSRLLDNPNVSLRLEMLRGEKEKKNSLESVSLRDRIIQGLLAEAEGLGMDTTASSRVTAWKILGQTLAGFYSPTVSEIDNKVTLSKSEQDLEKAITNAMMDGNVVKLLKSNSK